MVGSSAGQAICKIPEAPYGQKINGECHLERLFKCQARNDRMDYEKNDNEILTPWSRCTSDLDLQWRESRRKYQSSGHGRSESRILSTSPRKGRKLIWNLEKTLQQMSPVKDWVNRDRQDATTLRSSRKERWRPTTTENMTRMRMKTWRYSIL